MVLIGIDFGTTYCCMAYHNKGRTEIISDNTGNKLIPTCISFMRGIPTYGKFALGNMENSPTTTITNIKRLISRNTTNIQMSYETILHTNNQLYIVIKDDPDKEFIYKREDNINKKKDNPDKNDDPNVDNDPNVKLYTPVTIVSMILKYLKDIAENYLSLSVTGVVLTAPAYFDELQKRALKEAGELANIDIREIISEPTAAALCYKTEDKRNVLVYDIGGGTLDITLLVCHGFNYSPITKIGNPELGGVNFTETIYNYLIDNFESKNPNLNPPVSQKPNKLSKLKMYAEDIKVQLSENSVVDYQIEKFYKKKPLEINLSRMKFEALCKPLFEKCDNCLLKLLASIIPQAVIHDIIFIGGSSRIPKIKERVVELVTLRQPRFSLPGSNVKDQYIEPKIHNNINPDEAVAIGASIQAYALSNPSDINNVNLNEITSENIGIQVGSDSMDVIIEKNTKIPCSKTVKYGTFYDNQIKMRLKMYQGDDPKIKFNKLIGVLEIPNLPPRPKGEVKILLTIQLLKNGLMKLNAYEESGANGKHHETVINNLLEAKHEIKSSHSNVELLKKIKRIIINNNITDQKYLEFVSEMDKSDITVMDSIRFNNILNELLGL